MVKTQSIEMTPRELAEEFVEICRKRVGAFSVDSALKERFQAVIGQAFGTSPLKEYVERVFFESRKDSGLLPEYLGINLRKKEWGVFEREKVEEIETELLFYLSTQGTLSHEELDSWRAEIRVSYDQPQSRVFCGQPKVGDVIPFKRPVRRQVKRPTAKRRQRK